MSHLTPNHSGLLIAVCDDTTPIEQYLPDLTPIVRLTLGNPTEIHLYEQDAHLTADNYHALALSLHDIAAACEYRANRLNHPAGKDQQ